MEFIQTELKDAWLIKPKVFRDERGFFLESYSKKVFQEKGIDCDFIQDNHSLSVAKGVLRGVHFQREPMAQAKLVRVIRGKVFDAIVDLRPDSPTFGRWQGFELSAENFLLLFVPRGFGHGFCTLEENTEFVYKVDNYYSPEHDSGIVWNDPDLKIDWPVENPILSEKDKNLGSFKEFSQAKNL
jgi:dTDP-4-dehydrorhamnose 3,5-epimerase